MILGTMIDTNFRRALVVSSGNPAIFVTRPISLFFLIVIVFMVVRMLHKKSKDSDSGKELANE